MNYETMWLSLKKMTSRRPLPYESRDKVVPLLQRAPSCQNRTRWRRRRSEAAGVEDLTTQQATRRICFSRPFFSMLPFPPVNSLQELEHRAPLFLSEVCEFARSCQYSSRNLSRADSFHEAPVQLVRARMYLTAISLLLRTSRGR